jgi:hypothetical protein
METMDCIRDIILNSLRKDMAMEEVQPLEILLADTIKA